MVTQRGEMCQREVDGVRRLFLGASAADAGSPLTRFLFTEAAGGAATSAARANPRTTRYVPIDTLTS